MAKQTINPGTPPIIWSTVEEAFQAINDNFTELYLTVAGGPGTVVDLTDLGTSLIPRNTEIYDLGSSSKRWKDLYLSGTSLYLGNAVVTATGTSVNLPAGSTIGGNILDQEYFREIAVAGQSNIVADSGGNDILTIASGLGITLTTDDTTDTLTIANTGVLNITTSSGLSTNTTATGAVSITNTGVVSFGNSTALPDARPAGSGISVSSVSGTGIDITNTGVLAVTTFGGSGITINNPSPGTYEIVNSSPNINQDTFKFFAVSGQNTVGADSASDTLTLVNGTGIDITTNDLTDSITITNTGVTTIAASGLGINVSAATGSVNISNTGVTSIVAGSGISISGGTGAVTIQNTRNTFQNFAVSGSATVIQADNGSDTFTFVPGEGVVLTPDSTNDTLTLNISYLVGNVYSDNSTLLIDALGSQIVGDILTNRLRTTETEIAIGDESDSGNYSVSIGYRTGKTGQGDLAVAIGSNAGENNQAQGAIALGRDAGYSAQGSNGIAIGFEAGTSNQGTNSVAIGYRAGYSNQSAGSIVLNASGAAQNASAAGFFVNPVREVTGPQVLYYNPSDKEITWGPVPAGSGGGGGGEDFELNVAGDDSTIRRINNGETLKFIGANGVTTASDGEGAITITGPTNISGNAATSTRTNTLDITNTNGLTTVYYPTFVENRTTAQTVRADVDLSYRTDTNTLTAGGFVGNLTGNLFTNLIDSADSSQILVTPLMRFQSDVVIENELSVNNSATVSGTLTVNHLTVTGTITAQGSGTPEVYSDNEILLTAGTRVEISSSPLKMASFSTAERDALAATNGDIIYNSSTNKFQGYANSTWVDLH